MLHHVLHLLFGGPAGAHDRLLDLQRRVLVDLEAAIGQGTHGRAARLAQKQGRGRVGIEEDLFHGRHRGTGFGGDFPDVIQNGLEAHCQAEIAGHHDGAASDIQQARAVRVDDAEARASKAGVDAQDPHQWRKCRVPVNTIGMPRSSAAAMTSSSRMLPPGWITQPAPASTTTSRPSRKGKKASDATAEPARLRPAFCALMDAMRAESTRLIWPAPTPRVIPFPVNTMALDFTYLATFQAKSKSFIWASVGWSLVTTRNSASGTRKSSGFWTSQPPPTRLTSNALRPSPSGT